MNDHFEIERAALANAPDLNHGDLLVRTGGTTHQGYYGSAARQSQQTPHPHDLT